MPCRERVFRYVLLFFGVSFITSPVLAAFSLSIDSAQPVSVSSKDQPVTVHLALSDLPAGDSYLRVAWQEGEGKSYFGYMQNNTGDWVKIKPLSADCTGYFKVSDSATIATLSAKIGEDADIAPGVYMIKAHRFAAGCSYSSVTPTIQISVVIPTSTPTPASSATPTPTSKPTAIPTPTAAATPTPTKVPTPTGKPTTTATSVIPATTSATPVVLGATDPPASPAAIPQSRPYTPVIIFLSFVGLGLGILSFALVWQKRNAILDK